MSDVRRVEDEVVASHRLGSAFGRLLTAQALTSVGSGLHLVALPLLAARETSDPRLIAALAVIASLPATVLALPIGSLVDRVDRRRLLIGSDAISFAALVLLTIIVVTDQVDLWMLFAVAGLLGVTSLIFGTSVYALLPSLVQRGQLLRANSRLAVAREAGAGGIGPALGGSLFSLSAAVPFAVNAASFLGSMAAVLLIRRDHPAVTRRTGTSKATPGCGGTGERSMAVLRFWHDATAGGRLMLHDRALRSTVILGVASGFFGWMPEGTLVLFATDTLGASDIEFGLLMSVTAVGAIIGGLVAPRLQRALGSGPLLAWSLIAYGTLLIPVAFASSVWIVMVLFFLQGLPLIASAAAIQAAQQAIVPDELLGRFDAFRRLLNSLSTPLGLGLGGILASWIGLRGVWLVAGVGFVVVFFANWRGFQALNSWMRANGV